MHDDKTKGKWYFNRITKHYSNVKPNNVNLLIWILRYPNIVSPLHVFCKFITLNKSNEVFYHKGEGLALGIVFICVTALNIFKTSCYIRVHCFPAYWNMFNNINIGSGMKQILFSDSLKDVVMLLSHIKYKTLSLIT